MTVKFDKYSEEIQENVAKVNVEEFNYKEYKQDKVKHKTKDYILFDDDYCEDHYSETYSDSGKKYRITDSDYVKIVNPSVSVQKYVTSINGETLNESRENLYALKEGNTDGFMETPYKHEDRDIADGVSVTNTENIKKDNPVKAIITSENAFEATYRVVLYNNSNKNVLARVRDYVQKGEITRVIEKNEVTHSEVTHSIDKNITDLGNYSGSALDTLERQGNNIWHLYTDDGIRNGSFSNEDNWYTAVIELGANSTKTLDITVVHKSLEEDECIYNRVWVPATIQVSGSERVASSNNTSNKYRNIDADFVQAVRIPDVSLQKFVSKVGDEDTSNRENRMAVSNENGLEPGYNHSREINPSITAYSESETDTKSEQKQEVIGKKNVKYSIIVYNNGGTDTTVNLEDNIGINSDNGRIVSVKKDYMDVDISYSAAGKDIWQIANKEKCTYSTYSFDLEAGSSALIELEVEFFAKRTEDITNTAWIKSITVGNKTIVAENNNKDFNYRTVDADYVHVKATPDLSLEKYVVSVGDKNNNEQERISYEDRASHPIYGQKNVDSDSYNPDNYKTSKKVYSEKGDTITYNIVVKNVGESTAIVSQIEDTMDSEIFDGEPKIEGVDNGKYENGMIIFNDTTLEKGKTLIISVKVNIKNFSDGEIENTASLTDIRDENGDPTEDLDPRNNEDTDYLKEKKYKVSIEKYVSKVNENDLTEKQTTLTGRTGKQIYKSNEKFENPVTVNENDKVTYTIIVRNDGSSGEKYNDEYGKIKVSQILDALNSDTYGEKLTDTQKEEIKSKLKDTLIATGESSDFTFIYTVNVPNITLNVLTNTATINEIKNRNDVIVDDESADDNTDEDYIQLDDIEINGMVWNDKPLGKDGSITNGYLDKNDELGMDGIEVYLYRNEEKVAETITSNGGKYTFKPEEVNDKVIKAAKTSDQKKWNQEYYNYYVIFRYNGMVYTSTVFSNEESRVIDVGAKDDNENVSNAAEDHGIISDKFETREDFNEKFLTINKENKIKYTKNNDKGYIPNSKYVYDYDTMSICSSTNLVELDDNVDIDRKLKHVDLGLRNRDVFDLELVSDVVKAQVTVNGETAEYDYGGKVNIRKDDADNWVLNGDCKYDQNIRNTDFTHDKYNKTGLEIKVTYKITISNMSQTYGTATEIVDYYDNNYKDPKVYLSNNTELEIKNSGEESNYKFIKFEIPKEKLSRGESKEIFIELTVKDPETLFKEKLTEDESKLATYNMVEIAEYTTDFDDNNKYMKKGLIDRDSAPESAESETVNLRNNSSNLSTLDYYFAGKDLDQLKYEDDTFTAPVLYFVRKDKPRTITGIVFKDTDGNGYYNEGSDLEIKGADVTLVETVGNGAEAKNEAINEEGKVEYTDITKADGTFEIKGFLPGVHHMEYQYGNNKATLIVNEGTDSYNGYLYESTKNYYENVEKEDWYKGKNTRESTATERAGDRDDVSTYTKTLDHTKTEILNSYMNNDWNDTNIEKLKNNTQMTADTPNMRFDVELNKNEKNFNDYDVKNIDFGIRKRNETHITLDKKISSARITDSTGKNVLVNVEYDNDGTPTKVTGDAIIPGGQQGNGVDISMIDKNLQGAKLDITYTIKVIREDKKGTGNGNELEKEGQKITLIDYVPNSLNVNDGNWTPVVKGRDISAYDINLKNTINKVERTFDVTDGGNNKVDIKMETVLTAVDSTIESIITSADSLLYEYKNIIEVETVESLSDNPEVLITKQIGDSGNGDQITNTEIKPLLEGTKGESIIAASDLLSIHPPTGSEGLSMTHYIIGATALVILSVGIVLIKKFALKKE